MIRTLLVLGALVLTCLSCQKAIAPRYIVEVEKDFVLPAGLNTIETHIVVLNDVDTRYAASLNIHGVRAEEVKNVSPGKGRLVLQSGSPDLVFVREVKVRARKKGAPTNTANMYYQDEVNFNQGQELVLFNTLANLKAYFQDNTIDVEVRFKLRAPSPNEVRMRLIYEYGVYTDE